MPTFALVEAQNQITHADVHRIQGVANRLCVAFCTYVPCVSKKKFPDLTCYFSKNVCYFIKVIKEVYCTMLNVDLSISFISISAHIDFL